MTSDIFSGAVSIAGRVNIDVVDEQEGALVTGNFDLSEVAQKVTEVTRAGYCGPTSITGGAECYDGLTLQLEGKGTDMKVVVNDVLLTDPRRGVSPTARKKLTAGKVHVEVVGGNASKTNPTVISLKFTEPVTMKWVAEYVDDPRFSFGGARRPSIQFTSDGYKLMAVRDAVDPTVAESKRISREVLGRAEQRLTAHDGQTRVESRQLAQAAICHAENRFFEHEARSVTKLDSFATRSMAARLFTPASTERAQVSCTQSHEGQQVLVHPSKQLLSYDTSSTSTSYKDIAFNADEHASRVLAAIAKCKDEDCTGVGTSNSAVGALNACVPSPATTTGAYFDDETTSVTDTPTVSSTGFRIWRRAQSTEVRGSQGRGVRGRAVSYCRQQQEQTNQGITLLQSLRMTACMLRSYAASTGTPDAAAFAPFIQLVEEISQRQATRPGEALDLTTAMLLQSLLAEAMQRLAQRQQLGQEKWDIRVRSCSQSLER